MKEKIIDIIIKLTGYDELKNNQNINLIKEDILDSLAFIELIEKLEDEFNIEIQPTQIPKDTWNNVDNIAKMVMLEIGKRKK